MSFNELFICSNCHKSIAPELDRLDNIIPDLKAAKIKIENLLSSLEKLHNELDIIIRKKSE